MAQSKTTKKSYIEKFKGDFKKIPGGCTVIHTQSAQLIKNGFNLGAYVYICSKPAEWKINIKELMSHFDVGKDKIYKSISDLCLMNLIKRKEIRSKNGRFLKFEYYLYLSPQPENPVAVYPLPDFQEVEHPLPENPETEKPDAENQSTYKEKKYLYKKKREKKDLSLLNPKTPTPTPTPKTLLSEDEAAKRHFQKYNMNVK